VLQGDLHTAKQTCKDQEYHIAQAAGGGGADFKQERQACKDQEYHIAQAAGGGPDFRQERQEWQALRAEMTRERERLEARVRELEVLEAAWKQVRGIFTTKGPV
jgi:hypothetical protein